MTYLEKINQLPAEISTLFLSDVPRYDLEKILFMYGIEDDSVASKIAIKVGQLYINEVRLRELPTAIGKAVELSQGICFGIAYEINKRIFNKFPEYFKDSNALLEEWGRLKSAPILSEDEAWQKVLELEPWIAELENEKKEEGQAEVKKREERTAALVRMTLPEALKKYEKLGEQLLSGNPIKLKIFDAPVRPSVKNWISDYYEKVDARKHDSIERGNYLFHSENARRLTTGERNRVGTMLRALDEDSAVAIDQQRQEIVFEGGAFSQDARNLYAGQAGKMRETNKLQNSNNIGNRGGMSFSSGHKFPFEQQRSNSVQPVSRPRPSNNIVDLKNG